jgi:hypothetical protein
VDSHLRDTAPIAPARESADEVSVPKVDPVEHRIANVVAEMKRLKPDSMTVLLKPDAQTELHLQLQMHDGRVDIEARVQRGDFAALNGQWAQLQQNLASQGIRLGGLQPTQAPHASDSDSGGGLGQQPGGQPSQRDLSGPQHEPGSPRPATTVGKSKPANNPSRRSWESWA